MQLCCAAATLAVIGLRQIGQLEINCESFGELVGIFDGEIGNDGARLGHQIVAVFLLFGLAMLDQKAAEMFDHVQQGFAGLLYEDTAQQDSQGANITAEREVLWRSPRSRQSAPKDGLVGRP